MPRSATSDKLAKKAAIGRYWRKILGNMSDAIIVYDSAGNVVYANAMASENLRYASAAQLTDLSVADFAERYLFLDGKGKQVNLADMPGRRAIRENGVVEQTLHFVATKGKENFWLDIKAFPITDRSQNPIFVVNAFHDVTSFKETEAILKDTNRRIAGILDDLLKLD